jgi:hypothetical protein
MLNRRIGLFVEDYAHEAFIEALVNRLKAEWRIEAEIHKQSVTGGHGKVLAAFREYLRDLQSQRENYFDGVIVATDANCKEFNERLKEMKEIEGSYSVGRVIYAIPDPHIERWFLLDSSAFKTVFGRGCAAPDRKCERDRYKDALRIAVVEAGVTPPLGGVEYADDLVKKLDLERVSRLDKPFGLLVKDLQALFKTFRTQAEREVPDGGDEFPR